MYRELHIVCQKFNFNYGTIIKSSLQKALSEDFFILEMNCLKHKNNIENCKLEQVDRLVFFFFI